VWIVRRIIFSCRPAQVDRAVRVHRAISTRHIRAELPRTTRLANAVRSVLTGLDPTGPIWGVAMVKNEEDILEEVIRNLFAQGVDRVIVADNGSEDDTRAILERLAGELPVSIVDDPLLQQWQGAKLSMLSRVATSLGASWVIPFDADELWHGLDGRTVAECLRTARTEVVKATWLQYLPIDEVPGESFGDRFGYRLRDPDPTRKMAYRANWLTRLSNGSHWVDLPDPTEEVGLKIAHYPYRSAQQILRKARNGAAAKRAAMDEFAMREVRGEATGHKWFELEDADEDAATAYVQGLAAAGEVVHDPVSGWTR
jgi:hypothetical protein